MKPINKVIVLGGTHGNEWTGIFAIKQYAEAFKQEFPELDLHFILANPEAYQINKRFKDEDLNRAFQFLHEDRPDSYEHNRAKELKELIGQGPCFVLDLHSTTSHMGNTVIISHNQPLNFHIASQLLQHLSDTRIIVSPDPNKKYLASQSEFGMMIEVGPVPNGVINAVALEGTLKLIKEVLRAITTLTNLTSGPLEIYEEIEDIYYPQDENGELTAYIDAEFNGKDFIGIEGEYRPFKSFTGEYQWRRPEEMLYPIFINEAAYYPTKLAFTLCRKSILNF